jgi:hypothetical protein
MGEVFKNVLLNSYSTYKLSKSWFWEGGGWGHRMENHIYVFLWVRLLKKILKNH